MDELRIYYSHNPITYTLNKLIAQQNTNVPSQQITARGIEAEGAISVMDDGVWNIERTVTFLKTLLSINPLQQQLFHLFLPHTGYLLGKLVKISKKISNYSYVEEGQYSSNKIFGFHSQLDVDCEELLAQLKKCCLRPTWTPLLTSISIPPLTITFGMKLILSGAVKRQ